MKSKEYRGEQIMDTLTARLVPPDDKYPDCMCQLILTGQHLYVLEDNFDGTFETHFTFSVRQINEIATVRNTTPSARLDEGTRSMIGYSAVALMGAVGGLFIFPGKQKKKQATIYLMIDYDNGSEHGDQLYFDDIQENPKSLQAAFKKAKAALS